MSVSNWYYIQAYLYVCEQLFVLYEYICMYVGNCCYIRVYLYYVTAIDQDKCAQITSGALIAEDALYICECYIRVYLYVCGRLVLYTSIYEVCDHQELYAGMFVCQFATGAIYEHICMSVSNCLFYTSILYVCEQLVLNTSISV